MKAGKISLTPHAIQPIQQFRYTIGKNSSDASLIIDRYGYSLRRHRARFPASLQRQRLYASGHTYPRKRIICHGHRTEKHAPAFVKSLRGFFVYTENLLPEKKVVKFIPQHPEAVESAPGNVANVTSVINDPLPLLKNRFRPRGAGGTAGHSSAL